MEVCRISKVPMNQKVYRMTLVVVVELTVGILIFQTQNRFCEKLSIPYRITG